jgi:hypothetical protein
MEAILILAMFAFVALLMGAAAAIFGTDSRDSNTKTIDGLGA